MQPATYAPVYAMIYPQLASLSRRHGYALAVHGTMARDFDLICVPWIARPSPVELVVQDITDQFDMQVIGDIETKDHGRLCQTLAFGGQCFLDLSFTPTALDEERAAAFRPNQQQEPTE